MAVHRVAFSKSELQAIQEGSTTCALRTGLVAAPGDILLAGLSTHRALVKLKVTGFRLQVPVLRLTRRELASAGIRDSKARAEVLAALGNDANPTVNVIHFRLMRS